MSVAHVLLLAPTAAGHERDVADVASQLASIAARHGAEVLHAGVNLAPKEFTDGLVQGLLAVFPDPAAVTAYLEDSEHHAVVGRMGELKMRAVVADLAPAVVSVERTTFHPQ